MEQPPCQLKSPPVRPMHQRPPAPGLSPRAPTRPQPKPPRPSQSPIAETKHPRTPSPPACPGSTQGQPGHQASNLRPPVQTIPQPRCTQPRGEHPLRATRATNQELTFRYNSLNFYEVFIENPGRQFHLTLLHSNDGDPVDGPVWIYKIQKDDHPLSGHTEVPSCSEKHCVDEHLSAQGGKASFKSDRKRHFGMSKDLEVKDPKKFKELPRVREAEARMPKAVTVQSDRERLLGMLENLKQEELEKFKWFLRDSDGLVEFQPIAENKLEKTSTCKLVDLMFGAYTQHTVEVTKKVFRKMNRNDLVKKLTDTSS